MYIHFSSKSTFNYKKSEANIYEKDIIDRISDLCQERNWSYYKLAKESDIAYSTLNTLLNKPNIPTIHTLVKICNGFGITLSQFFNSRKMDLTTEQKDLLNLFNTLDNSDKRLALTYLAGLNKKTN